MPQYKAYVNVVRRSVDQHIHATSVITTETHETAYGVVREVVDKLIPDIINSGTEQGTTSLNIRVTYVNLAKVLNSE